MSFLTQLQNITKFYSIDRQSNKFTIKGFKKLLDDNDIFLEGMNTEGLLEQIKISYLYLIEVISIIDGMESILAPAKLSMYILIKEIASDLMIKFEKDLNL